MYKPPPRIDIQLPDRPKRPSFAVRKRDERVRRAVRAIRRVVPALQDERYTPLLRSYVTLTLSIERCAMRIRDDDPVSAVTGELRTSYNTLAALIRSQAMIAEKLALTPSAAALLAKPVAVLDLESFRRESDKESD